jgi:exportin-5
MQASVVVPLLVFCKNAIGMRDGRCCGVALRIFRSIVPEFQGTSTGSFPIPPETTNEVREFISTEVLRASIQSLHNPYFVDSQKDIGSLIAAILANYTTLTSSPRNVLLSLNNVKPQDVDQAIDYVSRPGVPSRQQRAIVLDLLKDLKGVSISEMGKLNKGAGTKAERGSKKASRSKMAQEFMTPDVSHNDAVNPGTASLRKTPDLEGVASMFNDN